MMPTSLFVWIAGLSLIHVRRANGDVLELNNNNIHQAVEEWFSSPITAEEKYGRIQNWDTSRVQNMHSLFKGRTEFNEDLSLWDTSRVRNMGYMFNQASSFHQDLPWDTTNVVFMDGVFNFAASFNGDISSWNTAKVRSLDFAFSHASSFNSDITLWDTSSLNYLAFAFWNATSFSQDLNEWDVTHVSDLSRTFYNASSFSYSLCWAVALEDEYYAARAFCGSQGSFDHSCGNPDLYRLSKCDEYQPSDITEEEGLFFDAFDDKISAGVNSTANVDTVHDILTAALLPVEQEDHERAIVSEATENSEIQQAEQPSENGPESNKQVDDANSRSPVGLDPALPIQNDANTPTKSPLQRDYGLRSQSSNSTNKYVTLRSMAIAFATASILFMACLFFFVQWKRRQIKRDGVLPTDVSTVVDTDSVME